MCEGKTITLYHCIGGFTYLQEFGRLSFNESLILKNQALHMILNEN